MKTTSHIGKIIDAHGIKGDVYCFVFSGDASWVAKLKVIYLATKVFKVLRAKPFKKGFIATLEGVTDRNQAEELKGSEVSVGADMFISEAGESLFLIELLNYTVKDADLGEIGKVNAFSSNGIQDLLIVSFAGTTVEIPFVKEFVTEIDHNKKIIDMKLPSGLLEINEPEKK